LTAQQIKTHLCVKMTEQKLATHIKKTAEAMWNQLQEAQIAAGLREKKTDFPMKIGGAAVEDQYDSYDEEDGEEEQYGQEYEREN
jgi:hypothetical protein